MKPSHQGSVAAAAEASPHMTPSETAMPHDHRRQHRARRRLRVAAVIVLALVPATLLAAALRDSDGPTGEPGALTEPLYQRPAHVPPVQLAHVTADWALDSIRLGGNDALAGGGTLADLDRDGDLDLVVANGRALALLWAGDRFADPIDLGVADAVAVTVQDLDLDTWPDILLARSGNQDQIRWGGSWIVDGDPAAATDSYLPGGQPSGILLPVDLAGDRRPEVVRLGRGTQGTADVIWSSSSSDGERGYTSIELPNSDRISLAGTIADIDGDGLVDIWVTRDVGWAAGGDSIYSRKASNADTWVDVADELGAALEIDGMGITLADLDGDRDIDAYVSDIGENEILAATDSGFAPSPNTGAGRIRPPASPLEVVSSSWASGPADINLDGRLDLVVVGGGFPDQQVRNKIPNTTITTAEPPAIFVGIGDGQFVDVWPELGLDISVVGRAMTLGDVDNDGDADAILVTRDGRVEALRNDTNRPSLTIALEPNCGAGIEIAIGAPGRSYMTLLPQFTYGGMHASQITVGMPEGPITVLATRGNKVITEVDVLPQRERDFLTLDC